MGLLDLSAFDPVFWLHHSNVDRLFAIWQALNPTKYVTARQSEGNFTTEPGTVESATSPLKAFGLVENDLFGALFPGSSKVCRCPC
jgi:tyrosinase